MHHPLQPLALTLLASSMAFGQASAVPPDATIDPTGLPGARLIGGGGKLPDAVYARFVELAGGATARIVLIPTASARADDDDGRAATLRSWQQRHPGAQFEVLHTRDRATADCDDFTAPLRAATGVWFGGGAQQRLAEAYVGTRVERELAALLARGGIVGGSSAGAAIQTLTMIQEGRDPPVLARGFDLVPSAIADQHFLRRDRLPRLLQALTMAPGHFGLGVDEGTAVLVRGRALDVLGDSKAVLVLAAANGRPQRVVELNAGAHADLVAWQRAARARTRDAWPPATMATPRVASGALVLAGGGELPDAVAARFVSLAGGAARARVVLVPSATLPIGRRADPFARVLAAAGVTDVRTIDCAHPGELTAVHIADLDRATAVWFGGGRQWRLIDAFDGTEFVAACRRVLDRGGVIGGSSAGATIQGDFLVRGDPLGNAEMWCEGYDRGFGFLPGCAVDQHFLTRNRTADLQQLVSALPQLIGIGIDEGTAAIVQGSTLEVVGASKAALFDARRGLPVAPRWLAAGDVWDLADPKD